MRVAFTTYATPDWSINQIGDFAKACGYDEIELRFLDGGPVPPDAPLSWYKSLRRSLLDRGITISCLGSGARLCVESAEELSSNTHLLDQYLGVAPLLGAPLIRFFGLGVLDPVSCTPEMIDRAAKALRKLLPKAIASDITLVVETHDVFARSLDVVSLMEAVDSQAVGVLWDFLHGVRQGESIEDAYANLKPYIRHVHVKDAQQLPDGKWQDVPPGTGQIALKQVVALAISMLPEPALSVEWEGNSLQTLEVLSRYPVIIRDLRV
jgi:sugar phosphate isomerase/epimerase